MRSLGITNAAPYATAPAVGAAGDTYFNTAAKALYLSDGTQWLAAAPATAANYWWGQIVAGPYSAQGNDVATSVTWGTNNTVGFTLAGSNQRITATVAGKYQVTTELSYEVGTSAAGFTRAYINLFNSGGTSKGTIMSIGPGGAANSYTQATAEVIFDMAVGDYIVIQGAIGSTTGKFADRCFSSIMPVGGAKGDTGASGALGQVGVAFTTGGQTVTTTNAALSGLQVSINVVAGHHYRFNAQVGYLCDATAKHVYTRLMDVSLGTQLNNFITSLGANFYGIASGVHYWDAPATGGKTFRLDGQTNAGNATTTGAATAPMFLGVEDIGSP